MTASPGLSVVVYLSILLIHGDTGSPILPTMVCVWAEKPFTLIEGIRYGVCEGGTNHHFFVPAI
jgi:hypothetical protein